jgi:hypothetical protein
MDAKAHVSMETRVEEERRGAAWRNSEVAREKQSLEETSASAWGSAVMRSS